MGRVWLALLASTAVMLLLVGSVVVGKVGGVGWVWWRAVGSCDIGLAAGGVSCVGVVLVVGLVVLVVPGLLIARACAWVCRWLGFVF